jgi:hypothetical protein
VLVGNTTGSAATVRRDARPAGAPVERNSRLEQQRPFPNRGSRPPPGTPSAPSPEPIWPAPAPLESVEISRSELQPLGNSGAAADARHDTSAASDRRSVRTRDCWSVVATDRALVNASTTPLTSVQVRGPTGPSGRQLFVLLTISKYANQ